jgi:two-component system chemotaxis response regulator CheY
MVKVMIADDSSFMRRILMNILTKLGYTDVVEASDGEMAVETFKSEKPDLCLLDIVMEKKDGVGVLKEIKATDANAKVIMVSAVGQEVMKQAATDAGAQGFVTKPFEENELKEIVKKVLG